MCPEQVNVVKSGEASLWGKRGKPTPCQNGWRGLNVLSDMLVTGCLPCNVGCALFYSRLRNSDNTVTANDKHGAVHTVFRDQRNERNAVHDH